MRTRFKLSDGVITTFLKFFHILFTVLGTFSNICKQISNVLPSSIYVLKKMYGCPSFVRYVVCSKMYDYKNCLDGPTNRRSIMQCSFRRFPNHSQERMRRPCKTPLLKTVELAGGRIFLYPFVTYCYLGLEVSLQMLLNRPKFFEKCENWRSQSSNSSFILKDVFDGNMWKNFLFYNGKTFLSESGNYALMLNFDFFQPYK